MNEHDRLVDRAAREARAVLFVGGLDSGKSSMARATAAYALTLGRSVAYLDADVSQKTVGPPGTVGLKHIREPDDLTHDRMAQADAIGFVGSTSPQDHLLPLVGAVAQARERANERKEVILRRRRAHEPDRIGHGHALVREVVGFADVLQPDGPRRTHRLLRDVRVEVGHGPPDTERERRRRAGHRALAGIEPADEQDGPCLACGPVDEPVVLVHRAPPPFAEVRLRACREPFLGRRQPASV